MNTASRIVTSSLLILISMVTVRAEIIDRILAVVGGELITLSDVQAAQRLGLVTRSGTEGDPIRQTLDALIERQMELTEVNRYLPPEPPPAAIERRLDAVRARLTSPAELEAILRDSGLTLEQLRQHLRNDERIERYLDQRFSSALQGSDEEIAAYYRSHPAEFTENGALRPYADVREQARARLLEEKRASLVRDWLTGLRRRIDITDLYIPAR